MQTVSLSFYRFSSLGDMIWMFTQMLAARGPLRRIPEVGFFKLLGTGSHAGFHPYPNFSVWAVLATWPSLKSAKHGIATAPVFGRFEARASEFCTFYLLAQRSRGEWSGIAPFEVVDRDENTGAIAVLTRATIRPRHLLSFWSRVPKISATAETEDKIAFMAGLGEVPWFHQVTFTVWNETEAISQFAHSEWHGEAIRAVNRDGWFSEQLFTRFSILDLDGQWNGADPALLLEAR